MNIFLDYYSRTPVYEQIEEQIILGISTGSLEPDEKLPSLRNLASELKININTIKRAFSELENQGVIYTVQGKGVFVNPNTAKSKNTYLKGVTDAFSSSVRDAKNIGVTEEELKELVHKIYKEE